MTMCKIVILSTDDAGEILRAISEGRVWTERATDGTEVEFRPWDPENTD
jgi:hypothetical protein